MSYDCLKLENQLCFPLYAASHMITKKYKPYLDKIGLTYTQYITMMVLWEKRQVTVKELGEALFLDSGTLTPLLKRLESKGFINRNRNKKDERELIVSITEQGEALADGAKDIPAKMGGCINIAPDEAKALYHTLYKILGKEV